MKIIIHKKKKNYIDLIFNNKLYWNYIITWETISKGRHYQRHLGKIISLFFSFIYFFFFKKKKFFHTSKNAHDWHIQRTHFYCFINIAAFNNIFNSLILVWYNVRSMQTDQIQIKHFLFSNKHAYVRKERNILKELLFSLFSTNLSAITI